MFTCGCDDVTDIQCAGEIDQYVWADPAHALWIFDIKQLTWRHQQCSGDLPDPVMCYGLAVVGDHAYTLANHPDPNGAFKDDPDRSRQMDVYMLDLKTWHWKRLPLQSNAPSCRARMNPTVVQVERHYR